MAKYTITHRCGHDEVHQLYGKSSLREYKIQQLEKELCSECALIELEKENQRKAEENEKEGLPKLIGTEKQIDWAESIRYDTIKYVSDKIEGFNRMASKSKLNPEKYASKAQALSELLDDFISHDSASWIINHRHDLGRELSMTLLLYMADPKPGTAKIYEPKETSGNGTVEIDIDERRVAFDYPKDYEFIDLMRSYGAMWVGTTWAIGRTPEWDSLEDCAAWMANLLVSKGYSVKVRNEDVQKLIDTESFGEHYERLISAPIKYKKKLNINGAKGEAKEILMKMRGAIELNFGKTISVPVNCAAEIEEFAEIYGFKISPGSRDRIDDFLEGQREKLNPTLKEQEESSGSIKDIMNSSMEVIDDLRDED